MISHARRCMVAGVDASVKPTGSRDGPRASARSHSVEAQRAIPSRQVAAPHPRGKKAYHPERTREGSGIECRSTHILREYAQDDKLAVTSASKAVERKRPERSRSRRHVD